MIKQIDLQFIEFDKKDIQEYVILLSAPVLLTLYRYLSMNDNFLAYFPQLENSTRGIVASYQLQFIGFFILLFIFPILHVKYILKKPLGSYGLQLGDIKFGLRFLFITIIFVVVPFAIAGAYDINVQNEYPLSKELLTNNNYIFSYELSYFIFYYIAWEFYFRGYLLFGLKDKFGAFNAILIQTISSCLVHIDKPFYEIVGSIPFGIFIGIIALRTKSIWYVFLVHALLGILVDLSIIFLVK